MDKITLSENNLNFKFIITCHVCGENYHIKEEHVCYQHKSITNELKDENK